MAQQDIRALTGLRGLAASLVAIYHFIPTASLPDGPARTFIGRGYLWVDLFFVLSGFVIALNYGPLFAGGISREAFRLFVARRVARIYPLYVFILAASVTYTVVAVRVGLPLENDQVVIVTRPMIALPANFLLVQSWGVVDSIVGTAWSVSTEWAAYLVFPLLAWLTLHSRPRPAVASCLFAMLLLVVVAQMNLADGAYHSGTLDAYDGTRCTPLLRCFGGFLIGMLMQRVAAQPRLAAVAGHDALGGAVVAIVAILFTVGAPDLAIAAAFPPLVLCLACNRRHTARLFDNPPLVHLGALSYAIYLLHPSLQAPTRALFDRLDGTAPREVALAACALFAVTTVTGLSHAAHVLIERPGRSWLRNVRRGAVRSRA